MKNHNKKPAPGVPGAGFLQAGDLVQLLGQLHAAHALVVAFDSSSFFALALSGGLFIKLTCAQLGEQAQFFNGALEAAQGGFVWFVFFDSYCGHL